MTNVHPASGLETKYCALEVAPDVGDGAVISGYASVFGRADRGGDIVAAGAYARSLDEVAAAGRKVKMLWQHDPCSPIGVWEEVREDGHGLYVRGRLLTEVRAGREALALLEARVIDGLSIGYRAVKAETQGAAASCKTLIFGRSRL